MDKSEEKLVECRLRTFHATGADDNYDGGDSDDDVDENDD